MNLPDSGVPSNKSTAAADSLSNSQTPSSDATQNLAYEIETYGRPRLTSSSSSATPSPSPVNYYDPESASPYARERKPSTLRVPKPLSTPISGSPLPKNIHFEDTPLLTAERNQLEHHRQLIRVDEDFSMQFSGYQTPATRLALYYCLCVLSGGTVYLLTRWFPRLQIRLIGKPVSLADATHVFIENSWQQEDLVNIRRDFYGQGLLSVLQAISGNGNTTYPAAHEVRSGSVISSTLANLPDMNFLRYFNYRCMMFLFNPLAGTFVENTAWKDPRRPISAQVLSQGLDRQAHQERRLIFGDNSIEIPEKGTIRLLVDEVLHPFYIFQALAIALWCFDQYYYYAVCIMLTSIVSCTLALLETKRNLRNLRNMARFQCDVPVLRSSVWRMVPSTELVPGDIVDIGSGEFSLFPCDCVLLSGDCIVNESMLTGESVPVFKTPANDSDLLAALGPSLEINPKYYLFGGTKIVRVRAPAGAETDSSTARGSTTPSYQQQQQQDYLQSRSLALVVRTGFDTSKGNLIREMIFPRPHQFQFYRDSFRFVGVLALIAMLGFTVSVVFLLQQNVPLETILVRGLDLFTIVVPPALPAAMSIGITFALTRLKRANIFCISPPRINITGKCNVVVFDKTGTLTEEGMDVLGVQNVISGR
jgi:cation-transporting ATPase 13A3/4/5